MTTISDLFMYTSAKLLNIIVDIYFQIATNTWWHVVKKSVKLLSYRRKVLRAKGGGGQKGTKFGRKIKLFSHTKDDERQLKIFTASYGTNSSSKCVKV